ncbi:MAG: M56 family metallopeptidase [Marinoscillum sp.]
MILYVLRFSLSLAIVYGFYRLVLEKEKSFVFNRTYLLAGLLVSLVVPLISFSGPEEFKAIFSVAQQNFNSSTIRWEQLINLAYLLISFVFFIRFAVDIRRLLRVVRTGELKIVDGSKIILTDQVEPPYSFFKYVFINRDQFEHVNSELIVHELTHVRQGHTIDILIIELIKAVFWINPMIGVYKRAMQLNHEFLADLVAIKHSPNTLHYQEILLGYFAAKEPVNIASGFNFSLTKKRFRMMTKSKSKTQYIKQLMVLPVLALILWACSDNAGVTGKEMLQYWRYTANMEEILRTGSMNEKDLKEGIIQPIRTRKEYDDLADIYNRMNSAQKESVYELPPYIGTDN